VHEGDDRGPDAHLAPPGAVPGAAGGPPTTDHAAFKEQYAQRAGIEGTLSQGIRAFELRRSRYCGQPKTPLQHVLIGASLNFVRVGLWLADIPRAKTRRSPFVTLMAAAQAA
jgi:hypothetical protein